MLVTHRNSIYESVYSLHALKQKSTVLKTTLDCPQNGNISKFYKWFKIGHFPRPMSTLLNEYKFDSQHLIVIREPSSVPVRKNLVTK